MTDTKRTPKPMTEKQIAQYQELKANLMLQAELIMSVFSPLLSDRQHVTEVKFDEDPSGPRIDIYYSTTWYGEEDYDFVSFPESYLGMTEEELKAENTRIEEEKKRKRMERSAKARAAREKRKAEKSREEAEKNAKEKDERYKKYLELKSEFEGKDGSEATDKPKKKSVYACKYFKYEYDDLGKYPLCENRNCKLQLCDCKRIYAQQVCPFYEKGELRGRWVISDEDKEAAEKFKQEFEGKVEK